MTDNVQYRIFADSEFSGATIFLADETKPRTVNSDHPMYQEIVALLLSGTATDEVLLPLINPIMAVDNGLRKLGERVAVSGGSIFFDGDRVDNSLTETIIRMLHEGGEAYQPLVAFMEKVATNPSKKSRKHLYSYVEANNITITEDGDLILYKGVTNDGKSTHRGYGIVNGVVFENSYIPNAVGDTIEIPRDMVDNDREHYCSVGLHAGNYEYAKSFSAKLLTVKVNPRDVVSVPSDYNSAKVRVCRYVVLENNKSEYTTLTAKVKTPKAKKAKKAAPVSASTNADKVAHFETIIPGLVAQGVKLNVYRSKRVTAARRAEFRQAASNLGYTI